MPGESGFPHGTKTRPLESTGAQSIKGLICLGQRQSLYLGLYSCGRRQVEKLLGVPSGQIGY